MSDFSIGLSALNASQRALDVIGENIANAGTTGYHRQVAEFTERPPILLGRLALGTGVSVPFIRRLSSQLLESALTSNTSASNGTDGQLTPLQQIETNLTPGTGNIDGLLGSFFNQLDQLTTQPDNLAQRRVFLDSAQGLANRFNDLASSFDQLRDNIDGQVRELVGQANTIIHQIADLNQQIALVRTKGASPNDQLDQRDALINQLAEIVDVRVTPQANGQTTVIAAGLPVVVDNAAVEFRFAIDAQGQATVTAQPSTAALQVKQGKIGGLLQIRNQTLPDFHDRLDALAQALAQRVDELHATGLGLSGPSTFLSGMRGVASVNAPLDSARLAFPPKAGSLYISITDPAGNRTLSKIDINPATQSLQDLANALNGVGHLQALVDTQTGSLKIIAQPGYRFDFAGRLATAPDSTTITGTTTVQIGGNYTGSTNDLLTYQVVGSGTIGVTQGLTLQVTNSAGATVGSFNIGQGYSPGSAIQLPNGVTVQLAAGTANAGDQFTTTVVSEPDSAGILGSLGLNTFFTGHTAGNLAVNPDLLANPSLLAASRTGQPADSSNLQRISGLRDALLLSNGTQTAGQFFGSMVSDVGTQVQQLQSQKDAQQALDQQLHAQQQAVSGVDPNEELVHMLQYQRAFQLASTYISTVNSTLNSLFQIIGT